MYNKNGYIRCIAQKGRQCATKKDVCLVLDEESDTVRRQEEVGGDGSKIVKRCGNRQKLEETYENAHKWKKMRKKECKRVGMRENASSFTTS